MDTIKFININLIKKISTLSSIFIITLLIQAISSLFS
jgi:hypothetical protein